MEKKPNAMYQARQSRGKKTIINEVTKSRVLPPWPFPVEVWVKIFNYLQNHDIRFGVSLVCKKFHEICQDELLVPVKDLCIYGHPVGGPEPKEKDHKQYYRLSGGHRRNAVVAVSDVIRKSKNLKFLKIKALNPEAVNELVNIGLRFCPKLTSLEIIEIEQQRGEYLSRIKSILMYISIERLYNIPDLKYNYDLLHTIVKYGRNLCSINLLIVGEFGDYHDDWAKPMIDFFTEGCPKLKSLTLESLRGWKDTESFKADLSENLPEVHKDAIKNADFSHFWDQSITKESLEALYKGCKELKDLKLTRVKFFDLYTEDEIKKILPGCNVEIKECQFDRLDEDDSEWTSTDDS